MDKRVLEALESAVFSGWVEAHCPVCGVRREIEPDAEDYPCWSPDCEGKISSPLIPLLFPR